MAADIRTLQSGKKVDFSNFTSLAGGTNFFIITEDAAPELQKLAQKYPQYLNRAMRHVSWRISRAMKTAITSLNFPGTAIWPDRSEPHMYRRLDMLFSDGYGSLKKASPRSKYGSVLTLKQKTNSGRIKRSVVAWARARRKGAPYLLGPDRRRSRSGRLYDEKQSIPDARIRWQAPNGRRAGLRAQRAMSGYIYSNLVYNEIAQGIWAIGALTPRIAKAVAEVQQGKNTYISPAMRRAFWAAGVPVGKGTSMIDMPSRPLVGPVFRLFAPHLSTILINRIQGYMEGKKVFTSIPGTRS